MELSDNYDALKLTLAELGFSSPELENSIRESPVKGKERFSAYFEQYHAFTSLHICFEISREEISSHYEMIMLKLRSSTIIKEQANIFQKPPGCSIMK